MYHNKPQGGIYFISGGIIILYITEVVFKVGIYKHILCMRAHVLIRLPPGGRAIIPGQIAGA